MVPAEGEAPSATVPCDDGPSAVSSAHKGAGHRERAAGGGHGDRRRASTSGAGRPLGDRRFHETTTGAVTRPSNSHTGRRAEDGTSPGHPSYAGV